MPLKIEIYDKERAVNQYTLSNRTGDLVVKIIDFGASITNILVKDKNGLQKDVALGWNDLDGYLEKRGENPNFGAIVGRVANRIRNGKFTLNGKAYQLTLNDGQNTLHGGNNGFAKRIWNIITETENSITFENTVEDGEEGFPGKLRVEVTYTVTETNELLLDYSAKLAENQSIETIVNLTNHSYFNLNGCTNEQELDVLKHEMKMTSEYYLENDEEGVTTGKILSVKTDSSIMDFHTKSHTFGEHIKEVKPNGYNHCYVIETKPDNFNISGGSHIREEVAIVKSSITGITLTFSTTEPSFILYTGNYLKDQQKTKKNQSKEELSLRPYSGFCLEAQRFPNAINEQNWKKQVILNNQNQYKQTTIYKFTVEHN